MNVGIDTFGCDHGKNGTGSYLRHLSAKLPDDGVVRYELFGSEVDRYTYSGNFRSVSVPDNIAAERFWHLFRVNAFATRSGYDVVLYVAGSRLLPHSFAVPGVAVVNELVASRAKASDWRYRRHIQKSLSRAACIVAASQAVRKDLERVGITAPVEVIHNGVDHSLFYPENRLTERLEVKPFAIKRPYFVYASRLSGPEKKHMELIKAFSLFKEHTGLPHRLVLAGSESGYGDAVRKAAFSSGAASDIFITGYFPHESFPELYRNAEACLFPAVNEGVGLPVLEAMATGIPVACAKNGALPELAGAYALYFDSDSPDDVAQAMEKISTDTALRERLSSGGIEWTKRFSWEKTAAATHELLKRVVAKT